MQPRRSFIYFFIVSLFILLAAWPGGNSLRLPVGVRGCFLCSAIEAIIYRVESNCSQNQLVVKYTLFFCQYKNAI